MAYSELANWDGAMTRKRVFPTVATPQAGTAKTMKKPEDKVPQLSSRNNTKTHSIDSQRKSRDDIITYAGTRRHESTPYLGEERLTLQEDTKKAFSGLRIKERLEPAALASSDHAVCETAPQPPRIRSGHPASSLGLRTISKKVDNGDLKSTYIDYYAERTKSSRDGIKSIPRAKNPSGLIPEVSLPSRFLKPTTPSQPSPPQSKRQERRVLDCVLIPETPITKIKRLGYKHNSASIPSEQPKEAKRDDLEALQDTAPTHPPADGNSALSTDDVKDDKPVTGRNKSSPNAGVERTKRRTLIIISDSEPERDEERTRVVEEQHVGIRRSNTESDTLGNGQSNASLRLLDEPSLKSSSQQPMVDSKAKGISECSYSEGKQNEKQDSISTFATRIGSSKPSPDKVETKLSSRTLPEMPSSQLPREVSPPIASTSRITTPAYISSDTSRHSSVTLVQPEDVPLILKQVKNTGRISLDSRSVLLDGEDDGIDQDDFCHQCRARNIYAKMKCTKVKNARVCPLHYCHRCILIWYPEILFEPFIRSFHCPRCVGTCKCAQCCTRRGVPYIRATRQQQRRADEASLYLSEQATQRQLLYGEAGAPPKRKVSSNVDDAANSNKLSSSSSSKLTLRTRVAPSEIAFVGDWQLCWGKPPTRFRDVNHVQESSGVLSSMVKGKGKEKEKTPDPACGRMYIGKPPPRNTKRAQTIEPTVPPVSPTPPARTPRKAPPNAVNARLVSAEERASISSIPPRTKRTRKPSQKAIEAAQSAAVLDALENGSQDADDEVNEERCRKKPRSHTQSSSVTARFIVDSPSPDDFTIPEPEQRSSPQKPTVACSLGYPFNLNYDWNQLATILQSVAYYTPTPTLDDPAIVPTTSNPEPFTDVTYSSTYALVTESPSNSQSSPESDPLPSPTSGTSTPTTRLPIKKHSLAAKDVNVGLFAPFAPDMLDAPTSFASSIDVVDHVPKTFEFGALGALQLDDVERAVRMALKALTVSTSPRTI